MARVMVVGGAGYIGAHVAKALTRAGHKVLIFDDLSTGFRELAKYGAFREGSILRQEDLVPVLDQFKPEAVMHFAARIEVGESVTDPALFYSVNVKGSQELLNAIRTVCPKAKIVFSSTCAVYGAVDGVLSEKLPLLPVNPYGRTKRIVEEMLADYGAAYGMRYTALRYFNAAGADSEGELGEMHNPETHLIPRLLEKAQGKSHEEVQIYGNDYETPDGTCVRDYIHVEDLAKAHLLAMDRLLAGGESEAFNLGTAKGSSVLEVIRTVEQVTGKNLSLNIGPRRAGDPPKLIADSQKAEKALRWRAEKDLESIVKSAWQWAQTRPR